MTYAPEQIVEAYYQWKPLPRIEITADTQYVNHPAYNADRGPVFIAGGGSIMSSEDEIQGNQRRFLFGAVSF